MSTGRYAEKTEVPSDRSRAEIERTLTRYGASAFSYGWQGAAAAIMFEVTTKRGVRRIRFVLQMPDRNSREFTHTKHDYPRRRSATAAQEAFDTACRQRWRALALVIKAKLEAIAANIAEFESEFLSYVVLPSNETVGEWLAPQLERALDEGTLPPMLPAGPGRED